MEYQLGDVVPSHFQPGIVTASYFASLSGCLLTIEILQRRTTGLHSWRSWLETLGCAVFLGLIGIWCMHFIGNRAIVLGNGEDQYQLAYGPGYTVLSVFLPIIGLSFAFAAAEYPFRSSCLHHCALVCTGVFAGLSVVGMHYIGNLGVSNYRLIYETRFLVASVIIAIGDCLTVLALFYTWREKWISVWWKRLLCALLLAGGISAMHFTASTHCSYKLKAFTSQDALRNTNVQVIVAGVLCSTATIMSICVLFFTRHRDRVLKQSSQKVMVACAMFDATGRILVTLEGVLPAREITDRFNNRTFDDEFDTAHPVFQWIFRVTCNWPAVSEYIPKMRSHLSALKERVDDGSSQSSSSASSVYEHEIPNDYSILFRERFCTAVSLLASSMNIPVETVGVLYDKIVETGTLPSNESFTKRNTLRSNSNNHDLELGNRMSPLGKGKLLFLTRQLNAEDVDWLLKSGFKMANVEQVSRNIAENMQVPLSALDLHMSGLKSYVDNQSTLQKPGTWLTCFALIPKPNSKGFDVAVKKDEQDQLPDVQFLSMEPLPWQVSFLNRMHNRTAPSCISFLEDRHRKGPSRTIQEQQFASLVLHAILRMSEQIPVPWFQNARFCGKPLHANYSRLFRNRTPITTFFSFGVCTDMHTPIDSCCGIARVPLSFFRVRHQCYKGSPNHQAFARDIHQEFGPLLSHRNASTEQQKAKKISVNLSNGAAWNSMSTKSPSRRPSVANVSVDDKTDTSSDSCEHVDKPRHSNSTTVHNTGGTERDSNLGGILVNSETVIKSDSKSEFTAKRKDAGLDMGMKTAVGTSQTEDTFVDALIAFTRITIPAKIGF